MAHTRRCAEAKRDKCRCKCGGKLHGIDREKDLIPEKKEGTE